MGCSMKYHLRFVDGKTWLIRVDLISAITVSKGTEGKRCLSSCSVSKMGFHHAPKGLTAQD